MNRIIRETTTEELLQRLSMPVNEYKDFLVNGILDFQKRNQWTKEKLKSKSIRVLETLYDSVE